VVLVEIKDEKDKDFIMSPTISFRPATRNTFNSAIFYPARIKWEIAGLLLAVF